MDDSCTHPECLRVQEAACDLARHTGSYTRVDIAQSESVDLLPWSLICPDFEGEDPSAEFYARNNDTGDWFQVLVFPVKNDRRIRALEELR